MGLQQLANRREREAQLDAALAELTCFAFPAELHLSPLLPVNFVLATNYVNSFPNQAVLASNSKRGSEEFLLSPTCCYPVFRHLEGTAVKGPLLITHKNTCFRFEENYRVGEWQQAFVMREYTLFASDVDYVKTWIELVKRDVLEMLLRLGIKANVERASDPFFNQMTSDRNSKQTRTLNLSSLFEASPSAPSISI